MFVLDSRYQEKTIGLIVLQKLRQSSYLYGRTLLSMLLFVWLSMAISPCVMANDLNLDSSTDKLSLHANMVDCSYCPAEDDSSVSMDLCKLTQNHFYDSMTFSMDNIEVDSYVLFEIPITLTTIIPIVQYLSYIDHQSNFYSLSPLSLTGILRI